jgi:uncharacterized membrane protein
MFKVLRIISVVFLSVALIGVGSLPYGFYMLLRLILCATGVYGAYISKKQTKEKWLWIFIAIAVLFNPLIPVHLGLTIWLLVDVIAIIILGISIKEIKE